MSLTNKGCFIVRANGVDTEFCAQSIKPIFDSLADENSGRNQSGYMTIHYLRPKLRKWEITMPPMTSTEAYNLISKIQGQLYKIVIWDISTDSEQVVDVYTSNGSADMYSGVLYNGLWRGFKFSAIEM